MSAEFDDLAKLYEEAFGEPPPVTERLMDVAPVEAIEMVRGALERGSPITRDDFPWANDDPSIAY